MMFDEIHDVAYPKLIYWITFVTCICAHRGEAVWWFLGYFHVDVDGSEILPSRNPGKQIFTKLNESCETGISEAAIVCWNMTVVFSISLCQSLFHETFGHSFWVTAGGWILFKPKIGWDGIFHPHFAIGIDFGSTIPPKTKQEYIGICCSSSRFVSFVSKKKSLLDSNPQVRNQLARDDGNDSSSRALQNFWLGSLVVF